MSNYSFGNFREQNLGLESKKMLIAMGVSMLLLTIWSVFTAPSEEELKQMQQKAKVENAKQIDRSSGDEIFDTEKENKSVSNNKPKKEVFKENNNYKIGIDVVNNRITYFELKKYKKHELNNNNIVLLDDEHFIESGWFGDINNSDIVWNKYDINKNGIIVSGEKNGLKFTTNYEFDDNYAVKIKQSVYNNSNKNVKLDNYSRAYFKDTSDRIENSYAFRGVLLMNNSNVKEFDYSKIEKQAIKNNTNNNGWIGFSDQYWITALVKKKKKNTTYNIRKQKDSNAYQIDLSNNVFELKQGEKKEIENIAIISPKQLEILKNNSEKYGIEKLDKAIDFGIFYFLSKPLLIILKKLYAISGNFGIAIILLTILVRMIIFPLAHRSYKMMARMKNLSPKLQEIKEKYKDDKKALQMATYQIYKDEKINPASAIIPMLFQIPIFFALYKVLIISIEMRDAPFIGWIVDLSSRDPSSIFNLFGLIDFEVPTALQIGLLPVIMSFTMFIQQIIMPSTGMDKQQQKIIKFLPLIFLIMFSGMPAGLVLYWSCSNVFTIIQQLVIIKVINREK